MPSSWAGFGKSPITVIKEALTDKFIQGREVNSNVINYSIFIDIADEERDLTVGVLDQHNSLFFVVDLQIDCPDDQEVIANVAEATYELYAREEPFYGRILIREGQTYYQLCHMLGSSILDPTMAALLLDLVEKEVLEIIGIGLAIE
jgi:hypothetical protein